MNRKNDKLTTSNGFFSDMFLNIKSIFNTSSKRIEDEIYLTFEEIVSQKKCINYLYLVILFSNTKSKHKMATCSQFFVFQERKTKKIMRKKENRLSFCNMEQW